MKTQTTSVMCSGSVGEVYTTWNGNELADPYVHTHGWRQVTVLVRELVQSYDVIQTHDRWLDWFTEEEIEKKMQKQNQ